MKLAYSQDSKKFEMQFLEKHQKAVSKACHDYNVDTLYAFGSVLTEQFNADSDIDFIVSINAKDPIEYGENYFELKFELERIFKRKIDLLEQKAIRNEAFRDLVNQKKVLVYANGNQSLA